MKGDLLWVYEGLTQYLGEILTPRSGLLYARGISRAVWRMTAAALDHEVRAALAAARRHGGRRAASLRRARRLRRTIAAAWIITTKAR